MTNLVAERSASEDIALLAGRIEISQRGEIALMEDWLSARGEEPSSEGSHGGGHGNHAMPEGYKVSADIEADQRIEISRMRQVLSGLGNQ